MKSIKFNSSELEFLKNHYELELIDAENYINEIKNILKKLGVSEKNITDSISQKPVVKQKKGKRGRPKKVVDEKIIAPVAKSEKKAKRGRKPNPKKRIPAKVAEPKLEKPQVKTKAVKKPAKKVIKKTIRKKPAKATGLTVVTPAVTTPPTV